MNRFSPDAPDIAGAKWGHGIGFNVAGLAGVEYLIGDFGLYLEGGLKYRRTVHDGLGALFGTEVDLELTVIRRPQNVLARVHGGSFFNPERKTAVAEGVQNP